MKTTNRENKTCIIIGNGEFPISPLAIKEIKNNNYDILFCDGAIDQFLESDFATEINLDRIRAIIGDLDSISESSRKQFEKKLVVSCEQNTNDLEKAVLYAKSINKNKIIFFAITGKREDHMLANFSLLFDFMNDFDVSCFTNTGKFIGFKNKITLESYPGQNCSVFADNKNTEVSCEELKWPLKNHKFQNLWQGSLNISTSSKLNFHCTGKAIIFLS